MIWCRGMLKLVGSATWSPRAAACVPWCSGAWGPVPRRLRPPDVLKWVFLEPKHIDGLWQHSTKSFFVVPEFQLKLPNMVLSRCYKSKLLIRCESSLKLIHWNLA
jgi:hypothetical protein